MAKLVDVNKVQEALDRAARDAKLGPPDVRAGRYVRERDAVDLITDCMYSMDYLRSVSDLIFSQERDTITVGKFYDEWFKNSGAPRKAIIPFNPGIIIAYLYMGILFAKENWFELLPEDTLDASEEGWGLRAVRVSSPKQPSPTVKYTIRRMRNSLGHGYPFLAIPNGIGKEGLLSKTTVTFSDVNSNDHSDTFDVTLTLDQLIKLVKKFHSTIHKHVREKI